MPTTASGRVKFTCPERGYFPNSVFLKMVAADVRRRRSLVWETLVRTRSTGSLISTLSHFLRVWVPLLFLLLLILLILLSASLPHARESPFFCPHISASISVPSSWKIVSLCFAPCGLNRCSYPIPTTFLGRFELTRKQVVELQTGRWFANATFVTGDEVPLPDYTIRGQILPVDSRQDGIPDYQDE